MPTSADLLLDTSAAIALIRDVDPAHESVSEATHGLVLGLSGHALFETFSVLTRLPGSARVQPERAAQIVERVFPRSTALPATDALRAPTTFVHAGIAGGAVYDGLVGLAARAAGITLLSCDRRAAPTYRALGVDFRLV
ncbi:ribonuclease [Microbacterium sp. CH12i]|uniref:PIN domain-containing protein n=1 Tax=Microbacterium sp. CH12i TaxID=1479651 RepID=UPI000461AE13|nr:PIN domain-containing protein [Microbacterium sp. CH12i]KDA05181.1 ribonuclease [Microbacterium sp. CH12i]